MSSTHAVFVDFTEHLTLPNFIVQKEYQENNFIVIVCCLKENICLNWETDFLNNLYRKHEFLWIILIHQRSQKCCH